MTNIAQTKPAKFIANFHRKIWSCFRSVEALLVKARQVLKYMSLEW